MHILIYQSRAVRALVHRDIIKLSACTNHHHVNRSSCALSNLSRICTYHSQDYEYRNHHRSSLKFNVGHVQAPVFYSTSPLFKSSSFRLTNGPKTIGVHVLNPNFTSSNGLPLMLKCRNFHSSISRLDKEKSKVEKTVDALKESIKTKEVAADVAYVAAQPPALPKKSIGQRIWAEVKHYYHGFRLLFIDISISARLTWNILNGRNLSRREHKLLVRTVSDIFRLVPFSVFIIVPFMELLLPVFIKLFPSMLPSTFQSSDQRDAKMKQSLKMKLEMAKFLQDTLDEMAVLGKGDKTSHTAKEFSQFFEKIRSSGEQATNEEIMRFSKLFEDEITLDSLNRQQLMALCKLLELQTFGTSNFLSFQLRLHLRNLIADDKMIKKEGIENLDTVELQQACKTRGMRAYGVSDQRLRSQLEQWLELSLNEKIPPSLLLLSRALYIPENLPHVDQLKATISTLPDSVATQAKAKIGEVEGKVDNKTKIEILRDEQKQIKKEKEEKIQQEAAEVIKATVSPAGHIEPSSKEDLVDTAPILTDTAVEVGGQDKVLTGEGEELSSKDLDVIEDALENIASEKQQLLIEKEELQDLKEELAEYQEDIEELKDVVVLSGMSEKDLRLNKASQRLYKQVNRMIHKMDHVISNLEQKGSVLKRQIEQDSDQSKQHREELVSVDEVLQAMRKLQTQPDAERLQKIAVVLAKMDDDHDGIVKVDDVLQVIELIGKEDVKLSSKQVNEIILLLEKEESLEFAEKIEKVVEREEQHKKAEAAKLGSTGSEQNQPKDAAKSDARK